MSAKTGFMYRNGLCWGPHRPPLMGYRLSWSLKVAPIAHCWLVYGSKVLAQLGPLRRSSKDCHVCLFCIESSGYGKQNECQ
ncbi:hypothetical protein ACN38_g11018 [Penicillium nordicum]|uniref:Uncharacterized protein n=1 Tax=Penicillium nordicum TaxID=229535 RepID=A0A0M8NVI1_9EURO|nr:hypothetical protein ACN38_g11018 [Penicillium nordicum]